MAKYHTLSSSTVEDWELYGWRTCWYVREIRLDGWSISSKASRSLAQSSRLDFPDAQHGRALEERRILEVLELELGERDGGEIALLLLRLPNLKELHIRNKSDSRGYYPPHEYLRITLDYIRQSKDSEALFRLHCVRLDFDRK